MKLRPRNEVIEALKSIILEGDSIDTPWGGSILDHRDINRLLHYLTWYEAKNVFGDSIKASLKDWRDVKSWDIETVKSHIESSLEFAFEKALGQRGISASLMHIVMKMWMWVICDDGLLNGASYSHYGLPYLYKIRDKYFPDMEVEY